jgi:hypothetical protein
MHEVETSVGSYVNNYFEVLDGHVKNGLASLWSYFIQYQGAANEIGKLKW